MNKARFISNERSLSSLFMCKDSIARTTATKNKRDKCVTKVWPCLWFLYFHDRIVLESVWIFTANKFYVILFSLFEALFTIFTLFVLANRPLFAATKQCKSAQKHLSTKLEIKSKQILSCSLFVFPFVRPLLPPAVRIFLLAVRNISTCSQKPFYLQSDTILLAGIKNLLGW